MSTSSVAASISSDRGTRLEVYVDPQELTFMDKRPQKLLLLNNESAEIHFKLTRASENSLDLYELSTTRGSLPPKSKLEITVTPMRFLAQMKEDILILHSQRDGIASRKKIKLKFTMDSAIANSALSSTPLKQPPIGESKPEAQKKRGTDPVTFTPFLAACILMSFIMSYKDTAFGVFWTPWMGFLIGMVVTLRIH